MSVSGINPVLVALNFTLIELPLRSDGHLVCVPWGWLTRWFPPWESTFRVLDLVPICIWSLTLRIFRWTCLGGSSWAQAEYDASSASSLLSWGFRRSETLQSICPWFLKMSPGPWRIEIRRCLHRHRTTRSFQSWALSSAAVVARCCHFCRNWPILSHGILAADWEVWLGPGFVQVSWFPCPSSHPCVTFCPFWSKAWCSNGSSSRTLSQLNETVCVCSWSSSTGSTFIQASVCAWWTYSLLTWFSPWCIHGTLKKHQKSQIVQYF